MHVNFPLYLPGIKGAQSCSGSSHAASCPSADIDMSSSELQLLTWLQSSIYQVNHIPEFSAAPYFRLCDKPLSWVY